ncbi:MAG: murein biosynthesis integral membrane protein MurJ [Desulfobacterales bacterium]|nr:murein biosynthesis integral membrane protein MurJ [Desulfobacterales bacterium]
MGQTQKEITRRAGIVGLGTFSSRILGLIRESVIVALFPKEVVDAYQTAFMIPNSFRRLTAEGAFSTSIISVFSKIRAKGDMEASRRFIGAALGFALLFLLALTLTGVFGARWFTWLASWGSGGHQEKFELATSLTRMMFPYILLISLTALAMGLLNSAGKFFTPAFAPVLLNISIIGSALCLSGAALSLGVHPVYALVFGVLMGGAAQIAFQIPSLKSAGLLVRPSLDFKEEGLIRVLKLTGPMVLGAAAYQIGIFISNSLAWTLPHGSVMYIQSANRLMEMPLAILVMAVSTAALPSLAALHGQGRTKELKEAYAHALRLSLFVATPAMFGIIVLSEPIITVLYQRGLFTRVETLETAAALRWLAMGICAIALTRQTAPVFYALERVKTPVVMTLVYIGVFFPAALLLKGPFLHEGLCMALGLAAGAQALGLVMALRKQIGPLGFGQTLLSWSRMLLASMVMSAPVHLLSTLGSWEKGGNSPLNIGVLALSVLAGVVVYAITAHLMRIREMRVFLGEPRGRR